MLNSHVEKKEKPKISFIIPAYNEEQNIGALIKSIHNQSHSLAYEVIVVDNGSDDATSEIVRHNGARLISYPEGKSIASVRNCGVNQAIADILVFLDADTIVTDNWHKNILDTIKQLELNPNIITGSRCLAPDNNNWLTRYWFSRLNDYSAQYINSGHLITTRFLFNKINGFSENLKTAEDYDFCMKAISVHAQIIENKLLTVIHEGYPETIKEFIARERWHGKEDFQSFKSIKESKLAWVVIFNLLIIFFGIIIFLNTLNPFVIISILMFVFSVSIVLSLYKFGRMGLTELINTSMIFSLYLVGRKLALWDKLTEFFSTSKI